ncbi:histidine kinase [Mucilaginibacter robiniae]|uniref:Histidine kinase n=1 Tax=Mucilaginibacter robiniae TaxID=2728022 RepID=A0A7L5E087_9SPHI|nr:histidine kinase [Mucilaginibacter robiniae]QJD95699.1 histidine kinase [Mucilaginibacter robiniae]
MRKKEIYYHIIGWIVYLAYIGIGYIIEPTSFVHELFTFSFQIVKILQFYLLYLWIYPKYLAGRKLPQLVAGLLLSIAFFTAVRYLLEEVIIFHVFHLHNYFNTTPIGYIVDNLYFGTSALVLSLAVYSSFHALRKEQENKSLREEKIQAELAFLKTQINPHFLYNTLNYIYSLAYPVSEKLADAVIKLSNLMRYMLTESADGTVDLQKEVNYIENYISVFQMRFEDAFFVDFVVEGDIAGKRIASLILVPFVENAFKHGVVNDPNRPIRIRLKLISNRLMFTVSNQINRNQKDHSTGIGLPNIRRRMELIYPGKHELLIAENGQTYKATLNIEL